MILFNSINCKNINYYILSEIHPIVFIFHFFHSSPVNVILLFRCFILLNQISYYFFTLIELSKRVTKDFGLLILIHKGISLSKLLVLAQEYFENIPYTCVVRQHHPTYFMGSFDIGALFWESHLDRGWTPRNKVCEFSFSDSLERFVYLCWINFSLYNIENWNVCTFLNTGRYYYILSLKKSSHYIKNSCFSNRGIFLINC